ncbi:hypothetical protein [Paraburkholderia domus]|uniref:hypothetical protein n=1 Tax=Paraburkholderia domus TaxID=2793075 RepID=UPI001B1DFFC5|nr:hypothetical protein [Paraburkholderia domus]CAE6826172.1 hypothetical protein R75483_06488 [Paraburkholderia domus]
MRTRVGHVVDVLPSNQQVAEGLGANIDLHAVGKIIFTDARTDAMVLERLVARVSTDSRRDYVFHLCVDGETGNVTGVSKKRSAPGSMQGIVAFDMDQPYRVERSACSSFDLVRTKTGGRSGPAG